MPALRKKHPKNERKKRKAPLQAFSFYIRLWVLTYFVGAFFIPFFNDLTGGKCPKHGQGA